MWGLMVTLFTKTNHLGLIEPKVISISYYPDNNQPNNATTSTPAK